MSEARFWYPASITQITEVNDSFDSCVISICYAGRNRNKTFISKEAIEQATPTMSYCPIVANYDVEADIIGGHDVDFVSDDDGLKMVHLTDAIGVVPENPQWFWKTKLDNDGEERDYLSTPAILWKRTPVYSKLKRDGVTAQSMEINIQDGKIVDGLYEIDKFEFTAFCLLGEGVEPCFEGASVEMFSMDGLKERLGEMMADFKKQFSQVIAASADDIQTPNGDQYFAEGGESSLKIDELLQKYGLTEADVDFEYGEMSSEEIDQRLAAIHDAKFAESEDGSEEGEDENEHAEEPEEESDEDENDDAPGGTNRQYQLTGEQMYTGILDALHAVLMTDEWGSWPRYCYTDYDPESQEVYAYDNQDWNLYGFKYTMNGDNVVIDFDSKTRKKLAFVDFDNGSAQFSYQHMMDSANARFAAVAKEVGELRAYKNGIEADARKAQEDEVFAKFADLTDDDSFNALRTNCAEMSIQDIEDKCYAIRGRKVKMQFSATPSGVRLPVEGTMNHKADEPYGGIFVTYGIGQ